jgi:hypothetical protein
LGGSQQDTIETQNATEKQGAQWKMGKNLLSKNSSSTWEPTKNHQKRKQNINSLLNAIAFPLFMAILVTVIKDGKEYTFYTVLMPLTFIGISLQVVIAIIIVCKRGLTYRPDEVNEDKKRHRLPTSTFNMWMQVLTVISLAINLAVHSFFTARVRKV